MSSAAFDALDVASAAWTRWEIRIQDFETAWRRGQRPALAALLPRSGRVRQAVLAELAHTELELRLKNGEPARVEEYLARFPELAAEPKTVLDLIAAEHSMRCRAGSAVGWEEYYARFPELTDALPTRFTSEAESGFDDQSDQDESRCAAPPVLPGYAVVRELGRGGMGVVYKAYNLATECMVALKTIAPNMEANEAVRARFRCEARLAARLHHPNYVLLLRAETEADRPFLEFEYIAGGNLADRLAAGLPPVCQAVRLVITLARALHTAHQRGILHCDLKPANVLLLSIPPRSGPPASHADDGVDAKRLGPWLSPCIPKIADFGLAVARNEPPARQMLADVMGTPAYMAPEQAVGDFAALGPATDVYGLGAVFYELLTGRPPFRAASLAETLALVRTQSPVPPSSINPRVAPELDALCLRCLRKRPGARCGSAWELAKALTRVLRQRAARVRRGAAVAC